MKVERSTIIDAPVDRVWSVLRDFNGHDRWHPAVKESRIEERRPSDAIGAVRRFRLTDGAVLRERLLTLSDPEKTFSYCLLDTPIPLLNYVAHVALHRVTDGERTFWRWWSEFDVPSGQERRLGTLSERTSTCAGSPRSADTSRREQPIEARGTDDPRRTS